MGAKAVVLGMAALAVAIAYIGRGHWDGVQPVTMIVAVRDASGTPFEGRSVRIEAPWGQVHSSSTGRTGEAQFELVAAAGGNDYVFWRSCNWELSSVEVSLGEFSDGEASHNASFRGGSCEDANVRWYAPISHNLSFKPTH